MSEFVLNFDGLPHFNAAVNSVLIGFTPATVMLDVARAHEEGPEQQVSPILWREPSELR